LIRVLDFIRKVNGLKLVQFCYLKIFLISINFFISEVILYKHQDTRKDSQLILPLLLDFIESNWKTDVFRASKRSIKITGECKIFMAEKSIIKLIKFWLLNLEPFYLFTNPLTFLLWSSIYSAQCIIRNGELGRLFWRNKFLR